MIIETAKDKYFMQTKGGIVESLFLRKKTTASGFYVSRKYKTEFFDHQGKLIAALIRNKRGENFFVSAGKLTDGKKYFMLGLSDSSAKFLGIDDLSYLEVSALADRIGKALAVR